MQQPVLYSLQQPVFFTQRYSIITNSALFVKHKNLKIRWNTGKFCLKVLFFIYLTIYMKDKVEIFICDYGIAINLQHGQTHKQLWQNIVQHQAQPQLRL